jgi:hypothetical protein
LKLSLLLVPSLSIAVTLKGNSQFTVGVPANFQVFESNVIQVGNFQVRLYAVIISPFVCVA